MEETRLRLEQEDAKLAWFRWHESRLALNDKRRAFVRAMESVQEEEAVTALANAMSLGFATSPSPSNDLFIEPFESVTPTVMIEEAEEVNVIEEDDIASDDFADASEMFIDESATSSPSTVLSLHSADDDERSVDIKEKDIVETVSAPDNMDEMRDGAKDLETHDHTSRAYLGEAFGTPLPLLLEQEMREIITRQSDVLGRYTTTVLMDHLALELHLDAIVRFTMGGELGFADALLNNLQSKCVAARERMTQGSARVMQTVLEGAIDDTGLRDDHMSKRLRLCENADALVSVDPYNLNLSAAVECSYAAPWPLNLIFADAGDGPPARAHENCAIANTARGECCQRCFGVGTRELKNASFTGFDANKFGFAREAIAQTILARVIFSAFRRCSSRACVRSRTRRRARTLVCKSSRRRRGTSSHATIDAPSRRV